MNPNNCKVADSLNTMLDNYTKLCQLRNNSVVLYIHNHKLSVIQFRMRLIYELIFFLRDEILI